MTRRWRPQERLLSSRQHALTNTADGEYFLTREWQDRSGDAMRAPQGSHFSQPYQRPIAVDGVLPLLRQQESTGTCLAESVTRRRPRLAVTPAPHCSPEGRTFVEFLNQTAIGLVGYDWQLMKAAAVIARLAEAAPEAKIVVHVASRRQGWDLGQELRAVSISAAAGGSPQAETAQVVCGTFAQLSNIPRRSNQPRIDVALDWQFALHARQHDQWLLDSDISRLLILTPLGDRFAPAEEDELRLLVGFDELRLLAAGRLPVDIGWAVIAHRQRWAEGGEFRDLFWRNEPRNNRIAGLARDFAFGALDQREDLEPALATFIAGRRSVPRVVVVVAQPEHGRELAVRLRVPCETGPGERPVPPPRRSRSRRELRIVTSDRLANVEASEIDVLIWAAGCRSLPRFGDGWWSTAADHPHRILWLDLSDEGRRDLASWARRRIASLRRWGGHPAGWDAAGDRYVCWLESRNEWSRR